MSSSETLFLIDGSNFIYRNYYGLRAPMTAVDGTPNNAVYGFVRLLLTVMRDHDPSHLVVAFDAKGDTFRHEIYPEYKANRREVPEDLAPQIPLCREATEAMGIAAIELDRFEADDVIGTLAHRWRKDGREVVIATADKDLMQLVGEHVRMWDGKDTFYDADGVEAKLGVRPEKVIDMLGLAGDTSDNVPGIPGVGPKTAVKLLEQHGDMEGVLAAAGDIKGKRGENLRNFADQARLSRRLCTVALDAPVDAPPERLVKDAPDPDVLVPFLRRMNFKRYLKELDLESHSVSRIDTSGYQTVLDSMALADVVGRVKKAGRVALACYPADGSVDAELIGLALGWAPREAAYLPFSHRYAESPDQLAAETALAILKPALEDPDIAKYGADLKGAVRHLEARGVTLDGLAADTAMTAFLLDANQGEVGLDDLSSQHLGHAPQRLDELVGRNKAKPADLAEVRVDQATTYAGEDADVALRICAELEPRLEAEGLTALNRDLEMPLLVVLARMEALGVKVDTDILGELSERFAARAGELAEQIHEAAGEPFNIDSPKQLAEVLFEKLGLPAGKKLKTGFSTDQSVLEGLRELNPIAGQVLEYRHLTKLRGTYLEALPALVNPRTGRIHTTYHQAVAATGRLSSSDPNLQNIPIRTPEGREIRRAFIAEPGCRLLSADYSQVELRLLAHYSEDPALLQAFADDADVHRRTAALMFGVPEDEVSDDLRRKAKTLNFGLMYGMGPFRLKNELGISQQEAKGLIDTYFQRYAGVKAYFDDALEKARSTGRATTLFGRLRPLPDIKTRRFASRQAAERLAINTPIQGTAADILKRAMVNLHRRLRAEGRAARMVLTVHDELVLEVPEDEVDAVPDVVREEMEGAANLRVPLKVDLGVGEDWAEIH